MRILHSLFLSTLAVNLDFIADREDANSFLSRSKRRAGKGSSYKKPSKSISKSTLGKVAAGAGAVYLGGKLAQGVGKGIGGGFDGGEMEEMEGGFGNPFFNGGFNQEENNRYNPPPLSEEQIQAMEEIREEPEEEREGPFNIFGFFRGLG